MAIPIFIYFTFTLGESCGGKCGGKLQYQGHWRIREILLKWISTYIMFKVSVRNGGNGFESGMEWNFRSSCTCIHIDILCQQVVVMLGKSLRLEMYQEDFYLSIFFFLPVIYVYHFITKGLSKEHTRYDQVCIYTHVCVCSQFTDNFSHCVCLLNCFLF